MTETRGLVLGGGGPVGRAWQTGLVASATGSGLDLRSANNIVGTSAGAIVGAEIALGRDLLTTLPRSKPAAGSPRPDPKLMAMIAEAATAADPDEVRRLIGSAALAAETPDEATALGRPNVVPMHGVAWPPRFAATAVSVTTGKLVLLDSDSGASLQEALAASSALPGVWPPITIGADRFMDGGVRSSLNVDAVAGADRVLIISCHPVREGALAAEIEAFRRLGGTVEVVAPSNEFVELTGGGRGLLDPELEAPAFELGRRQWETEAARITAFWTG
ncbi:patatin-like phospholipase family protein [Kribbella sp. NPDC051587]|uniref:patatin-like phospholipase family protein n=1 Tax=Kribbella sp. NPDC051587 TaxID=3364119 RepID=UPI0037AFEB38